MENIRQLIELLRSQSDEVQAEAMSAYMRNRFTFLGIKKPKRTALTQNFLKTEQLPSDLKELKSLVISLWEQPEREFQYVALDVLGKKNAILTSPNGVDFAADLVCRKPWWDTVDILASNIIGQALRHLEPELVKSYTESWIKDSNFWLNRTAILFQLKYKGQTNTSLLFDYCQRKMDSDEFFIQKAIGWALREYSKTDASAVVSFIETQPLKPLSRREGLKWLKKRGLLDRHGL